MTAADLRFETKMRNRVLALSTIAFTLLFAVWLMFGILAIPIRSEMNLTPVQFSWLVAIAVLNGALWRLPFGILTDRIGGRRMFIYTLLLTAIPTFAISYTQTYTQLLICAFALGLAGNSFSVGIAWNAAWFPRQRQGFAMGMFGAGNVGASVTKLIGPGMIAILPAAGFLGGVVPGGWRAVPFLYGVLLLLMAAAVWMLTTKNDKVPGAGRPLGAMLRPLKQMRVWRFSLYYVVVFGAYVALSVWLPKYYQDVYGVSLGMAALLTALFILPASLLRPLGGYFSDRFGARRVTYGVFGSMTVASLFLALPEMRIVLTSAAFEGGKNLVNYSMNIWVFTALLLVIGVAMGVGKASVYKYIPEYFPKDVGAVGGLVGSLGALGGFVLPLVFGYVEGWTGIPQTTFLILLAVTVASLVWLHITVVRMVREIAPQVGEHFEVPPSRAGSALPAAEGQASQFELPGQERGAPGGDGAQRHGSHVTS